MKFKRLQTIEANLSPKRILVIYGPRRVGKTTMLEKYLKTQTDKKTFYSTGDDIELREIFRSQNLTKILDFARPYEIIALDEAQFIPSIGIGAKMMVDDVPGKKHHFDRFVVAVNLKQDRRAAHRPAFFNAAFAVGAKRDWGRFV